MDERINQPGQVTCTVSVKVDVQTSRGISDADLILIRKLDECLGINQVIERHVADSWEKNMQLPLAYRLHQYLYSTRCCASTRSRLPGAQAQAA